MNSDVRQLVGQEQQAFIEAIFSQNTAEDKSMTNGLITYRNNIKATAANALSIIYPTVVSQIGQELMDYICQVLLFKQPPCHGDWAEWGVGLPNFLKTLDILDEYPFVAESARLDLAVHQVERATDSWFEQDSLALLGEADLDDVFIKLNDSVQFFNSPFPIVNLRLIAERDKAAISALENAICENNLQQNVLIYRPEFKAQVQTIDATELEWLTLLSKELSIGESLDVINQTNFDFTQWLPIALERNLLSKLYIF